jgi:transcriptional regulator with XRE-family HTH domain
MSIIELDALIGVPSTSGISMLGMRPSAAAPTLAGEDLVPNMMQAGGMAAEQQGGGAFGAYVRAQRRLARLSLRQLSELTQISNPYLSQIERGLHQPSVTVIKNLARALGVSVEALLAQAAGVGRHETPTDGATEAAIAADGRLDDAQKAALLAVYHSMVARSPEPTTVPAPVDPSPPAGPTAPVSRPAAKRATPTKAAAKRRAPAAKPSGTAKPTATKPTATKPTATKKAPPRR